MNFITVTGNLGRDAEMRYLQDSTPVLSFSVADSQGKDKPAIWWDCSLFGKRGESLSQYLLKGQQVTVVGQVSEREYTAKDGAQKKAMSVRVSEIALQGGKRDATDTAADTAQQVKQPAKTPQKPTQAQKVIDADGDIPF